MIGVSFTLLISALVFIPASAQAASVSANCSKIKSQVLAYESQEKGLAVRYEPVNGKWSWFSSSAYLNDYWLLQKKIVYFEVTIFTYDLNHMSCFTTKQQVYAKFVYKEWVAIQGFLKAQPDWINGFSFTPIVWDSIYAKDLVTPVP